MERTAKQPLRMENNTNEMWKADGYVNLATGLYHNRHFFRKGKEYLEKNPDGKNCLVAIDIEHFRIFNKIYGRQEGDRLLLSVAGLLKRFCDTYGGIAGYIGGDNFAILIPVNRELVDDLLQGIIGEINKWNSTMGFWPAIGIYMIEDPSLSVGLMYDRATIALSKVVGNYSDRICEYRPDMENSLEEEVQLLAEVQEGLKNEEFFFVIQPQCNINTGKIVGGETLVRWNHQTKGMISPAVFIPVLEKNGFIADLDRYVWRRVCKWLRKCIDSGYHVIPVSINISRIDIFSMDVAECLKELVKEYRIPTGLLKVEITESAYAENNDKIIRTVKQLRESDFIVMMDDFGSGYSSLNMLKSVAVDVLKIDMRFLQINEKEGEKGIGILESVVNMARQMRMPIIVEGVETKTQENYLRKMGCRYTQGYYYYKPLPIEEFEKLICDIHNIDFDGFYYNQNEAFHVREFLDDNLFNDTVMNNILGAAAFYEMYENCIEITRVNEQYCILAGVSSDEDRMDENKEHKKEHKKRFWNHVMDEDRHLLASIFEQAYENPGSGADGYIHYLRPDGKVLWIYMRVFFMRERDGHKLFYGALTDMTEFQERRLEKHLSERPVDEMTETYLDRMEEYYGDLPFGYLIVKVILDERDRPVNYEISYANREIERLCGDDLRRLRYMVLKMFAANKAEILYKIYLAAFMGEKIELSAHSVLSGHYLHFTMYQYEYGYATCIVNDVTHQHVYSDALNSIVQSYRAVYFIHLRDNYVRMIYPDKNQMLERGNYEEFLDRHTASGQIIDDEEGNVRKALSLQNLKKVFAEQDEVEYKYRRTTEGIGKEWCMTDIRVSERAANGIAKTAIVTIRSIEALMREKEDHKKRSMTEALSTMQDGFLVYNADGDESIVYANPTLWNIFGCVTLEEFRELTGGSFHSMVHPDDIDRVEAEIGRQIEDSDRKMDFVKYRIIRKDGEIRWLDDYGHLEYDGFHEKTKRFYVFVLDITDTITGEEKEALIRKSSRYKNKAAVL